MAIGSIPGRETKIPQATWHSQNKQTNKQTNKQSHTTQSSISKQKREKWSHQGGIKADKDNEYHLIAVNQLKFTVITTSTAGKDMIY